MSDHGGHGEKFSRQREAAIAALLAASNLGEAAQSCRISVATLRRWRKEPKFAARYAEARAELLEFTINKLNAIGLDGVTALHRVAVDKTSPAGATVSAGRAILEVQLKAREVLDLTERLNKLEEALRGEG
jgi:hypothetical protein